jgi:hypothetical protein
MEKLVKTTSSLGKFLSSRQPYQTIAAFGSGILLGIIPNWVVAGGTTVIWFVAIATVVTWLLSRLLPKGSEFDVTIKNPQTIRNQQEAKMYARQGFIGFVPLFTPKHDSTASKLSFEQRIEAVKNLDFDTLEVEQSNFAPTIKAILSHQRELKHCWLLATTGSASKAQGSIIFAKLLAEYLRQKYGIKCNFYYGDDYIISLDEDSQVLGKTYDLVQQVFKEVKHKKLSAREIVADITTGFRSMTLGMILACLDEERDIEFIGTHYDERGKPDGSLIPIIFNFKPQSRLESI